jgi:phosphatidylglycerol:prolipoprotein diacylglycerol transferase
MLPVLVHIPLLGGFDIPTYGVMLAIAFLAVLKAASSLARREGLEPRDVLDLALVVFLAGLVGAKLLLVLLDLRYYLSSPQALASTLRSAGVLYGGVALAVPIGVWFARRRALPAWKCADIAGICLPLGESIGRLGCLAAGCCYGLPSSLPWAITFTSEQAHAATGVPIGTPLHPTQLYLSVACGLLALILGLARHRKKYDGQIFLWSITAYGVVRFVIERLRGDEVRGFLVQDTISTSQAAAAAAVLLGLILMAVRRRRARGRRT